MQDHLGADKVIRLALTLMTLLLAGCTDARPQANLQFLNIEKTRDYAEIKFNSDMNLDKIFKDNKNQRPVHSELICSLSADANLEFDHRLTNFANGTLTEFSETAGKNKYNFKASLLFWRSPADESGSDTMLADEEVINLLRQTKEIPCLYRMTIYLSEPYYTKKMTVPSKNIIDVLEPKNSP